MREPLLAVAAKKLPIRFPVFASPKLDGVRAWWPEGALLSRKMKPFPNKGLESLASDPAFSGLDGEFIVGELSRVLDWMDSHALGELPFGPTEDLQEEIRNLKAKLEKAAKKFDRQATRLAEVQQALVDMSAEAGRLRLVLQDPRVAFTASHLEHPPLETLEWIVEQETAP